MFTYLLTLVSLGLLFPFAICYKQKWIAKHAIINCKKIVFDGKALSIIGHYLLWWILSAITFGIYGLWLPMKVYGWQVKHTHIKLKDEEYTKQSVLPAIIGIVFIMLAVIGLITLTVQLDIPAVISGDKKITDIFKKNNGTLPQEIINYDVQGIVKKESECPNGYEYDKTNHYCVNTYFNVTNENCDTLGGQYHTEACTIIVLKPSTTSNNISCINDYNEDDNTKRCYKIVSTRSEEECLNKNGFYAIDIYSKKWCTIQTSTENLLDSSNSKTDNSTKKTQTKSKCNSGYKYDSASNTCYNVSSGMEPTAGCGTGNIEYNLNCYHPESSTVSCNNGEEGYFMYKGYCLNEHMAAAQSIFCPNGYKLSGFDFDDKNWCYKSDKPNY